MKKWLMILMLVVVLIATTTASPLADQTIHQKLVAAEAKWVVQIDMKRFLATHLGRYLATNLPDDIRDGKHDLMKELKVDILDDVDRITIYGLEKDHDKAVICVDGRFDRSYILKRAKGETKGKYYEEIKYGKFDIYRWGKDEYGAFANDNRVCIAHGREALQLALDVLAGKAPNLLTSPNPLKETLKKITSDAFLVAITDKMSSLTGGEGLHLLNAVELGYFFITEEADSLRLVLRLGSETEEKARQVSQFANGLLAMAQMNREKLKEAADLIGAIKISQDGKMIQFDFAYPSDKLIDLLSKNKKGLSLKF